MSELNPKIYISSKMFVKCMRKGDLAGETVVKLLIALAFLLILTIALYLLKDKMVSLLDGIKRTLRFGG